MAQKENEAKQAVIPETKEIHATTPVRVGDYFVALGVLTSTCGTRHIVWQTLLPVPLAGLFINLGICSIDVTISGPGVPNQNVMIPSKAGLPGSVLLHPGATQVEIKCLGGVGGGDCTVIFALVWPA
jgi:hypothetical protein